MHGQSEGNWPNYVAHDSGDRHGDYDTIVYTHANKDISTYMGHRHIKKDIKGMGATYDMGV